MKKPRVFTDAEQVAVIDAALAEGWSVRRVDIGPDMLASVTFAKVVRAPESPLGAHIFTGLETLTREWGCGLVAARHAKDIMDGEALAA